VTSGLIIFVVVQALNLSGLALDLVLYLCGLTTVSERVWARPLLGVPIVVLQAAGAYALATHFWGGR
jgi:hypothetical protein